MTIPSSVARAQTEVEFGTNHKGVNYEIVLYVTNDGKYQVSTLKDKGKKRKLVNVESEYFKTTLDTLFSNLSVQPDSANEVLSEVSKALFEKVLTYMRVGPIESRLKTTKPGAIIGTVYLEHDSTSAISSTDDNQLFKYHFDLNPPNKALSDTVVRQKNVVYQNGFKVSKVEMAFEGGMASEILVTGKYYHSPKSTQIVQYRNLSPFPMGSPKEIGEFNSGRYLLFAEIKECPNTAGCGKFTSAIDPSTVIRFERHVVGAGTYVAQDTVIKITTTDTAKSVPLRKYSFIRNFDARVYSDVTGLARDNPNGVLQIEVKYEHVFNTKTVHRSVPTLRSIVLMNKISPFVVFPKLQDKFSSLRVDTVVALTSMEKDTVLSVNGMPVDTTITVVSRGLDGLTTTPIDAIRYANLHLGVGVHLLDYFHLKNRFSVGLDFGLYRTRLDTLSLTDHDVSLSVFDEVNVGLDEQDVLFYYIAPKFSASFVESRKFDFDILGSYMIWRMFGRIDDNVKMVGKSVLRLQANVNVHPSAKSREESVFFRASLFKAFGDLGDRPTSNLTLQIGYSTPISKVFGVN